MADLTVTPGYLETLAAKQDEAASAAGNAAEAAKEFETEIWVSHGVVSQASNHAFSEAVDARRSAGEAMKKASTNLAAKLRAAEAVYHGTDEQASSAIEQQMQPS